MDVKVLPLEQVAADCARESERFQRGVENDERPCLELFRRAIVERIQAAWNYVFDQYQAQLQRWVRAHSGFRHTGEEVDYFVNEALSRFWHALTPEKFRRFDSLGRLLQYLKMCVGAVILDHLRANQKRQKDQRLEDWSGPEQPVAHTVSRSVQQELRGQQLWELVTARLNSGEERLVARCVFVYEMSAGDIAASFPHQFEDVRRVYRVKENIMRRLRRDDVLLSWLEGS